jgi:hypothetical protein
MRLFGTKAMNTVYQPLSAQQATTPVAQAVQNASARTGIDFGYLMDVARVESNFDPDAKAATSSARGLFQFTNQTWLSTLDQHGANHGLGWASNAISRDSNGRYSVRDAGLRQQILAMRDDPAVASSMAAALTADNRAYMEPRIGRPAESVDLYLAHFLGSGGAINFLSAMQADPNQAGAPLLPEAAAANQSIFYGPGGRMRSLVEIRELFRAKLDSSPDSMMSGMSPYMSPDLSAGMLRSPLSPMSQPMGWEISSSATTQAGSGDHGRPPLQMMEIQPMPKKLSMGFAADAYRRLASLSGERG